MKAIIFTGPSLRAMAAGLKSASRRLTGLEEVNKRWSTNPFKFDGKTARFYSKGRRELVAEVKCPFTVGEERWVRETWRPEVNHLCGPVGSCDCDDVLVKYAADGQEVLFSGGSIPADWTLPASAKRGDVSPLFMPRWASRWTVRVTGAGLQHLQEVTGADARAEGVSVVQFRPDEGFPLCDGFMFGPNDGKSVLHPTAIKAFTTGWDEMHPEPWARSEANPFAWWFSFEARRTSTGAAA